MRIASFLLHALPTQSAAFAEQLDQRREPVDHRAEGRLSIQRRPMSYLRILQWGKLT